MYKPAATRESRESGELPTGVYRALSLLLVTVVLLFRHTVCYFGSPVCGGLSKAAVNFGTSFISLDDAS